VIFLQGTYTPLVHTHAGRAQSKSLRSQNFRSCVATVLPLVFAALYLKIDNVTFWVTIRFMITSFLHKGLAKFYKSGISSGIQSKHTKRLRLILTNLDQSESPNDMDLPGLRLHELKGSRKDTWSVSVSGNWRVTFRFEGTNAQLINYEDYH
jgi:proteic killer suppression protein